VGDITSPSAACDLTIHSTRTRSGIAPRSVLVSVRLAAQCPCVPVNSDVMRLGASAEILTYPKLTTAAHLLSIAEELKAREPIFHRPEFGTTRADFERMTAPEFWEVGASGRRYSREYVIENVVQRHASAHSDIWEVQDFYCQELGLGLYLAAYTLVQGSDRVSRRSTLWRRTTEGWKIVYHQGTLVEGNHESAA
jgi:hypothetical protein